MPYTPSDYDSAVSSFNVMPESMAVEHLINLRQQNEQGGFINRGLARKEKEDLSSKVQVDGFNQFLSDNSSLSEDDWGPAVTDRLKQNPGEAQNKDVMEALRGIDSSRISASQSKGRTLQDRQTDLGMQDADWNELHLQERHETATLESSLKLKEAQKRMTDFSDMANDSSLSGSQMLAGAIGNSGDLPPDVTKSIIMASEQIGDDETSKPYISALTRIIGAHGASENIMASYASELQLHGEVFDEAQRAGIDLNAVSAASPENHQKVFDETKAAILAATRKRGISQNLSAGTIDSALQVMSPEIDKAIDLNSRIFNTKQQSGMLLDKLRKFPEELGDLPSRVRKGDLDAQAELNGKMGVLGYEAFKVQGEVDKGLRQNIDMKDRQMLSIKERKAIAEVKSTISSMSDSKERTRLMSEANDIRAKNGDIKAFNSWIRMSAQSELWKKLKTSKDYSKMMDDLHDDYKSQDSNSVF